MEVMELPKVLIWRPKKEIDVRSEEEKDEEKEYGHVALKTDKYYVSIWSARDLNNGKFFRRWMDGFEFMGGVEGSLVLNINVDRKREDNCDPVEYEIDVSVTNKDLNPIIEEFLLYNKINAEDVTLERGEELFLERQEYDKLSTEQQAKKVKEPQQPITSLLKTEYSISAELLSGKDVAEPFYHNQQSCVSLVFNLLQAAWLKHHPDRPIPIFVHDIFEVFLSHNENKKRLYRVTWFESVVRKNFISISNTNYPSFIKPLSTIRINANELFFYKVNLFFFLLLVLVFYFYPFWRSTVIFGICIKINHPLSMIHFHIVLFLMMLSYIDPVIPFISILFLNDLYDLCMRFVEWKRSGELEVPIELVLTLYVRHLVKKSPFMVAMRDIVQTLMKLK